MFAAINVANLGPITTASLAINDGGVTTIEGSSEAGKSSIMDAVCILLTGKDSRGETPDNIKDGADGYRIEATTPKGTVFARTRDRKGKSTRTKQPKDGVLSAFADEESWRESHAKFAGNGDLTRCVVVSRAWESLAEKDLGRPLRNLIQSLLPPGDLRGTIAGMCDLRDGDPLDEAGAKVLATAANKSRDEAKGALDTAKSPPTLTAEPEIGDVKAAETTIATAASWAEYRTKMVGYDAAKLRVDDQIKARDLHRANVAALGKRPTFDAENYRRWEAAERHTGDAMQAAIKARGDAENAVEKAKANVETFRAQINAAKEAGDACPTCKRGGWEESAAKLAQLTSDGVAAKTALALAEDALSAASKAEEDAIEAHKTEAANGEHFTATRQALNAYDAELRGLGAEPGVQAIAGPPVTPFWAAPSEADVTAAKATKDAAQRAAGIRTANEAATKHHADRLTKAEADYTAKNAEAERVAKLVRAVREAPSKIANEQKDALGDFGPVTFEFPAKATKTTPEIVVKIDGRDWSRASTGRRIYASAMLQIGLRRLAKLPYLPIFIDEVQSYSGAWGDLPQRVIRLHTTSGPLRVAE